MKILRFLPILALFFACSEEPQIGTKVENNHISQQPIPKDPNSNEYDEYFIHQWHLLPQQPFSINIISAWEITKGKDKNGIPVKIAVLDDDIQKTHEDFQNIAVFNILNSSSNCEPKNRNRFSHGTAVVGVTGARQNTVGTIGVAPESEILFIGDSSPYIFEDAIAIKALDYAKNWGAKVISCSWGSENVSSIFESKIKNLYDNGIVVVFACGNDNRNLDMIHGKDESEIEWAIGVSASNENGNRAGFSNYGSNIDIMAPGTSVLSLDLMGEEGSNDGKGLVNSNYGFRQGTSFSAPIVAGVAALVLAANQSLTPSQVREIIIETAKKTTGGGVSYNSEGFSLHHAYGLIDAGEAVIRAAGNGNTAISE